MRDCHRAIRRNERLGHGRLRLIRVVLLSFSAIFGSGTGALADGYETARGLYHDCSEGSQARLEPDRAIKLRKCQNYISAVAQEWLRQLPVTSTIENPRLCLATAKDDLDLYMNPVEYTGGAAPFLEYWDARGLGFVDGWTTSARSAVIEFLAAKIGVCSLHRDGFSESLWGPPAK